MATLPNYSWAQHLTLFRWSSVSSDTHHGVPDYEERDVRVVCCHRRDVLTHVSDVHLEVFNVHRLTLTAAMAHYKHSGATTNTHWGHYKPTVAHYRYTHTHCGPIQTHIHTSPLQTCKHYVLYH